MAPKIFLTGVTGFIGGAAFAKIHEAHPDYEYTLFVRSEERGKLVAEKYPDVKFVYGDLSSSDVIEKAAAEADVVVHTADSADSAPAAKAIAKGLAAGHTAENPGYWIHLSGTGILTFYDADNKRLGEPPIPEQKYNDIKDIDRLLNLPDSALHRDVEKIVQEANSDAVKILILSPPTIYGIGGGPVNQRSIQIPNLAHATIALGYGPFIGAGKTEWDHVNINDLADLFNKVVEATQDPSKRDNPEIFGKNGYFFARGGEHLWADVAAWVAEEASRQGYLSEPKTKSVSVEEVAKTGAVSAESWSANSKGEAERAKKYLGWEPKAASLKETIADAVATEAKRQGFSKVK
ncbi:nucleoside-diphosphate-sugar epimerase [Fusarium albosuccineum]|uniref:Nucleoside-diphosphate-sugar epimerase n=1 Tax=Fusarium albosuccineum TaxID=1237068 RepID=A0A8H4KFU4_9HYPO|nr:nucleoside-diphosphate-sugar epimerase [Fusarium albosuccineum]